MYSTPPEYHSRAIIAFGTDILHELNTCWIFSPNRTPSPALDAWGSSRGRPYIRKRLKTSVTLLRRSKATLTSSWSWSWWEVFHMLDCICWTLLREHILSGVSIMLRWQYRTNFPYTLILLYCYAGTVPRTKASWAVCERGTLEAHAWKSRSLTLAVFWHSKVSPAIIVDVTHTVSRGAY